MTKPKIHKDFPVRRIALPIAFLLLVLPALASPQEQEQDEPKTRTFAVTIRYSFSYIPKEFKNLNFWFPSPIHSEQQAIHNRMIQAPYGMQDTTFEDTGNIVMHMLSGPRGGLPITVKLAFDVERKEFRRASFEPSANPLGKPDEIEALKKRWLQPDSHTPLDEALVQRAKEVTEGRSTPLEKARAIYEYVVDNIRLVDDPRGQAGSGFGNVPRTLAAMNGNSVDMAAVFVGLCRASGIPARTVIGMKIPVLPASGIVHDYHSWAEFYLDGVGWVPADPAEGQRGGSRRGYYFGSLDQNRLTISRGRDIVLSPPQAGEPLNYLVNPYWEANDEAQPNPSVEVRYADLEYIPNRFGGEPPKGESTPPPQTSSR